MIKIAITGNIASGKSCVEKLLSDAGYKVADTDKINHSILSDDNDAIKTIIKAFSQDDILSQDMKLSREKLGKVVFADAHKKNILENILHPIIKKRVDEFCDMNKSEKFIFISAPVLFECGMDKDFDKIIFVYAPDEIRLKRLIMRNNYSKEYAIQRMQSQENQDSKVKKSDFVIYNDSDFENLKHQIDNLLLKLTNL